MSRYRQTMREALEQVYKKEDNDHEISMARGELEAIADKATQLAGALQGKSDEGNPLEAWVQSKITKAKDYINSVSDYMMYKPENAKEEVELEEKNTDKYVWSDINTAMMRAGFSPGMIMKVLSALKGKELSEELSKELDEIDEKISDIFKANKEGESIDDIAKRLKLSTLMVKKLIGEAKDEEEKKEEPKKEENKESEIQSLKSQVAMLKQKLENEKNKAIKPEPNPETGEVPLTIGIAHAEFKKKKEEVKEENLQELSKAERDKRIQRAKDMIKYYDAQKKAALKGPNKALAKKMLKNETELEEGTKPTDFKVKMKTPSGMKMVKVTIPVKDFKVDMAAIEDAARKKVNGNMIDFDFVGDLKMGESQVKEETLDEFTSSMIKDLQKSYADLKGKTISPEKANALSKHLDRLDTTQLKQLVKANIPFVSTVARNKVYKKTGKFEELEESKDMDKHFKTLSNKVQSKVNELLRTGMGYWDAVEKAKKMFNEDRRLYVEAIAGLQKKADKSGMPYSVLKQVYDRGMAAWKSGHRPGASQQQWAFARVNSFITKSSGTWGGADKDLAAKVKGSK